MTCTEADRWEGKGEAGKRNSARISAKLKRKRQYGRRQYSNEKLHIKKYNLFQRDIFINIMSDILIQSIC